MIKFSVTTLRTFETREEAIECIAELKKMSQIESFQSFYRDLLYSGEAIVSSRDRDGKLVTTMAKIDEVQ